MATDKTVLASVCRVHGHTLASLHKSQAIVPASGQVYSEFAVICIKCGAGLDELDLEVRARRGAKRKTKGTLSSPPPPISGSTEEDL